MKLMSLNDKLDENETLGTCHKAKYCERESEAYKEIDKVNKDNITNLQNRIRLSNSVNDCMVYLMRGELGSRKDIMAKLERKIEISHAEKCEMENKQDVNDSKYELDEKINYLEKELRNVRMENQSSLMNNWMKRLCKGLNTCEAKYIKEKANAKKERDEMRDSLRKLQKILEDWKNLRDEKEKVLSLLEEHDDELLEDYKEKSRYINRMKWYIRFKRRIVSELMFDVKLVDDSDRKTFTKLCKRHKWMKEKHDRFYNEVHEV